MNKKVKNIISTFNLYYQRSTNYFFSQQIPTQNILSYSFLYLHPEFCSKGAANKSKPKVKHYQKYGNMFSLSPR